jgi:hypothetical protein
MVAYLYTRRRKGKKKNNSTGVDDSDQSDSKMMKNKKKTQSNVCFSSRKFRFDQLGKNTSVLITK